MWRSAGAFIAGFLTWAAVGWLAFLVLRTWPDYAVAEPAYDFTLSMQVARLLIGAICSIAAGCVVAIVMRRQSPAPWILGAALLAIFTPFHIQLWNKFPVWYHLFFLVTLIPFVGLGARLITQSVRNDPVPLPGQRLQQ